MSPIQYTEKLWIQTLAFESEPQGKAIRMSIRTMSAVKAKQFQATAVCKNQLVQAKQFSKLEVGLNSCFSGTKFN